ncbi:MAG: PLDc N-terminal domain-containing protein [Daejeonella sp.]|uniref:PLDc N-terminal domain-containing protein n=1 Tax=Daejeonella sp. TaxID=2805397 RepID=UPI0027367321|nr:PLDc N-terminal domain-containing protein [Daejeonella sp.]MDP3467612.1 PLDc N-terminal domain-containing protein [Daejeonella sp.]
MITLLSLLFIGGFFRFLLGILWAILIIYTLLDLFRSNKPTNTKLLWLIVILIAPILGSIIYFVVGRTNRI